MRLDFDTPVHRRGTASLKWDRYPEGVLPLWVADMDFLSPPAVVEALRERAEHGVYGYAVVPRSLVTAVLAHLASAYGWYVQPEWLVWLPSVVPGLNLACRAFAGPDDAVMTITPVYPPFLEAPAQQGRRLICVPATRSGDRWQLPLEAMEAAVTPETRVLLFCHPHNPLGRVWTAAEVTAVTRFCRRHDLVLVSDEIHCDLVLDGLLHVPAAVAGGAAKGCVRAVSGADGGETRIVTLMSPSKTFNLPGLNFAFAVISDAELRARFEAPGAGVLPYPGCFAVTAAEAAYRAGGEWLDQLLNYLRGNRDLVEETIDSRIPGVSMTHVEATYLAWLDVREWEARQGEGTVGDAEPATGRSNRMSPAAHACLKAGVALSPGAAFGDQSFLRLNFACPRETLHEALRRLRVALG